jgi:hypothetical protein
MSDSSCTFYSLNLQGLGRVAILGTILGIFWGVHVTLLALLSAYRFELISLGQIQNVLGHDRLALYWQWCAYNIIVCTFHLLEFFVTAVYNPSVVSSDSFLINHSAAYTAAALVRTCRCLMI